jgi:hypothetical protein
LALVAVQLGRWRKGRQLAFLEADYDQHMNQFERIEKARYLRPQEYVP